MAAFSYKGVEYEFVNTQTELLEELKCPICLELVSDPVQTSCGHLFCEECIEEANTCPVDRKRFTSHADNFNDRRVRNFKVKCPHKGRGCKWQGDLGDAQKHLSTHCDYQTVKCYNAGCDVKLERRQLRNHMWSVCLQRKYKCPYCSEEDRYFRITTTHFTVCEDMPLACPSGCGHCGLVRRDMAQHLSTDCPNELVPCMFAIAGCQQVVQRKDLQEHLQDKDLHLNTVLMSYISQSLLLRDVVHAVKYGNHDRIQASLLPLPFCPWLLSTPTCYPRPPWVFKMKGVLEKKEKNEVWYSDPVYSHFGGYKICLTVYANGLSDGKGTHVSVYVSLMRGENDDNLKWPFKGTIKVSLPNQLEDGQHYTKQLWLPNESIPDSCRGRVIGRAVGSGLGYDKFISHNYGGSINCHYLKDDTLFFRVDSFELKLD